MNIVITLLALVSCLFQDSDVPFRSIGEHDEVVEHVSIGPKGKRLATVDATGLIKVWDLKKGELLWSARSKRGGLSGLGLDEDGGLVYGHRGVAMVKALDKKGKEKARAMTSTRGVVRLMVADPDGRWGWLGCNNGTLIRLTPGNVNGWSRRSMGNGSVTSLAAGGAGKLVAVGGADDSIRTVTAQGVQRDKVLQGHEGDVLSLGFDAQGKILVSGSADKTVRVWDPKRGKLKLTLEGHDAAVRSVAVSSKTKWIASGDEQGRILVWDLKKGARLLEIKTGDAPVTSLAFTPDGKTLACLHGGMFVVLWDLAEAL